jgi:hypothetical protein
MRALLGAAEYARIHDEVKSGPVEDALLLAVPAGSQPAAER